MPVKQCQLTEPVTIKEKWALEPSQCNKNNNLRANRIGFEKKYTVILIKQFNLFEMNEVDTNV